MKNLLSLPFSQTLSRLRSPQPAAETGGLEATSSMSGLLMGLMAPTIMMGLNMGMFGVALPTLKNDFGMQADMAAWVATIYTLPFMIFMPLYGRLGDALGKRRLLLAGTAIFLIGTVIVALSPNLGWLMVGRAVQGFGTSSITPLCIAIISQLFPAHEQGRAMGTWNSMMPLTGLIAPFVGGLLVDHLSWRAIFGPILLIGFLSLLAMQLKVPVTPGYAQPGFLRRFDWGGVILLSASLTSMLFFVSSRPITGVAPLQDWRLLGVTTLLLVAFVYWEKRRSDPFITLSIFSHPTFNLASLCAGLRMFTMSGIGFIMPLYLADIYNLSAAATGMILGAHAGALFITLRFGGQLADNWGNGKPIVISLFIQTGTMIYLTLLPATGLAWVVVAIVMNGLAAGLALASLHKVAMAQIPKEHSGVAAGVYSMIRFAGTLFGTALGGVVLQYSLDSQLLPIHAYQVVFGFIAVMAFLGALLGMKLGE
jgi:EmrB/QacA subfamily drug resistance transporter